MAPIFALFTPDTTITTFYGETPARRMRADPGEGEEPLADFFTKAIDTFDVSYSDFEHVVDVEGRAHLVDLHPAHRGKAERSDGALARASAAQLQFLRT